MTFFQEYALLIGVATPVLVVVAIQAWLYFMGERGTLLLPSLGRYPSVDISEVATAREPLEVAATERGTSEEGREKPVWLVGLERRALVERRASANRVVEAERVTEKAA